MELGSSKCKFLLKNLQELHESACSKAFLKSFQPQAEFEKLLRKEEAECSQTVMFNWKKKNMVRNFALCLDLFTISWQHPYKKLCSLSLCVCLWSAPFCSPVPRPGSRYTPASHQVISTPI